MPMSPTMKNVTMLQTKGDAYQLFPDPETSVINCLSSNSSPSFPFSVSLTTPSSISIKIDSTCWPESLLSVSTTSHSKSSRQSRIFWEILLVQEILQADRAAVQDCLEIMTVLVGATAEARQIALESRGLEAVVKLLDSKSTNKEWVVRFLIALLHDPIESGTILLEGSFHWLQI